MPRVYHQLIKVESELLQTNMKDRITGAKALMRALQAEGVKTIFGYPGGSIMPATIYWCVMNRVQHMPQRAMPASVVRSVWLW